MLGAFAYWNSDDAEVFERDFFQKWSQAIPGFAIFSRDDVAAVFNRHMPEYVDMFLDIAIPSPQSDVCRFAMLYEFGGLYTDCHFGFYDTLALQSFFSDCHRHQVAIFLPRLGRLPVRRHVSLLDCCFLRFSIALFGC
ncbi:glycosyltransferase [Sphingobium yanoikuyae]|uniref:glycosyltransferase n=1 Tax=Sphingobium yanoikuyae TaxID=13690 RepID=UPI0035E428B0